MVLMEEGKKIVFRFLSANLKVTHPLIPTLTIFVTDLLLGLSSGLDSATENTYFTHQLINVEDAYNVLMDFIALYSSSPCLFLDVCSPLIHKGSCRLKG